MKGISNPTALKVWEFIQRFVTQHRYGPTYLEIMAACGIKSKNTVSYYVRRFAAKGLLTYTFRYPRSIRLVEA